MSLEQECVVTQQMLYHQDCRGPSQQDGDIIPMNATGPKTYANVIWVSMHT